uniref:Zinc finger Ran-binding domain-containing protein 2 n=2 Tax=Culex pipiens TaxID=7175 RepID=A0A8D8G861_CULPI
MSAVKFKDDWICTYSECKNVNFAHRRQCNRCGRDRSLSAGDKTARFDNSEPSNSCKKKVGIEIGKFAAEKSKGLFSAEDWQCQCGNVNWARRNTCNLCNAPRFCENEKRTGYGGGYNDRGVVEYKKREDYDDEYDEFGRKKKRNSDSEFGDQLSLGSNLKPRDNSNSKFHRREETKLKKDSEKKEDGDDDDEGDSDADVSKYDLWNLSDDDDGKKLQPDTKATSHVNTVLKRPVQDGNRSSIRSLSDKRKELSRSRSRSPFSNVSFYRR